MTKLNVKRKILDTAVTKLTCGFKAPNYKTHKGADLVPSSTSETPYVFAYDEGFVMATGNVASLNDSTGTAGMGTFVAIKHPNGLITRYEHLKYNSLRVRKGDKVKRGQVIATYGRPATGNAKSGSHLHFDLSSPVILGDDYIRGTFCGETRYYINPLPYLELNEGTITGDVNIRTGAGTSFSIIGEKKKGEKVIVYGRCGGWVRIDPTKSRWIHKNYLKE